MTPAADDQRDTLERLEAQLRASGLAWTAALQDVPTLPEEPPPGLEVPAAKPDRPRKRRLLSRLKTFMLGGALFTPVDWRDRGLGPVKHQGDSRACTTHAIASALEDRLRLSSPPEAVVLDAFHAHVCVGRQRREEPWDPKFALQSLATSRIARQDAPPQDWNAEACARAQGYLGVSAVQPLSDVDAAKTALKKGPIVAMMDLWEDLHKFYAGGLYSHQSGAYLGKHTVEIVGFDREAWIVRNSYGPGWGEQGFARVAYGECRLLTLQAYAFQARR